MVSSAIINIMNAIWFARNQIRFNNKRIPSKSSISYVLLKTYIGDGNAFQAELIGAMRAIETAHQNSWNHLWLERDSAMVLHALKANIQMPCNLRNIWNKCKHMIKSMIFFFVSHVFREGNQCTDGLSNIFLTLDHFTTWNYIPSSLQVVYIKNKLGWLSHGGACLLRAFLESKISYTKKKYCL